MSAAAIAIACSLAAPIARAQIEVLIPAARSADSDAITAIFRGAGMSIVDASAGESRACDVVVLLGRNPALASLADRVSDARCVLAVGDGVIALASCGALDDRFACVAEPDRAEFIRRFPRVRLVDSVAFVADERDVTCAGGDGVRSAALFVVERLLGEVGANAAAAASATPASAMRARSFVAGRLPPRAYRPGDRIDPATTVLDAELHERRVLDLARSDDRVIVLTLFGGGGLSAESDGLGGIWCEDSRGEMALLAQARARFAGRPVAFVGVACPPVRHAERFGFAPDAFRAGSPHHAEAVARFVAATEAARDRGTITFERVWFDPAFRLLGSRATESDAARPAWAGRWKATRLEDRYGTPTTWILARDGTILAPPFSGNAWERVDGLEYRAADLEDAIATALRRTAPS